MARKSALTAAASRILVLPPGQERSEIFLDTVHRTSAPKIIGGLLESRLRPAQYATLGDALRKTAS